MEMEEADALTKEEKEVTSLKSRLAQMRKLAPVGGGEELQQLQQLQQP